MLIRFDGSDKLWNTDFFLEVNVEVNRLVIFDTYCDEHSIVYESHQAAIAASSCLLGAVGGVTIFPKGKLDESNSWKDADVYRGGEKINPKDEDDKNDKPF